PRCRRCQCPLPDDDLGGVVRCGYCQADNIAGIDLRPLVDQARGKHRDVDVALAARRREQLLWAGLSLVALIALAGWVAATWRYLR
ncbi:MAG: hypothetical protein K8W52_18320, partial [Deltaproteobacteria bacterium]|nr:hypothetical protein [Deltaproteobacteria bacterium]